MKIYWRSRDWSAAPQYAQFYIRPFSAHQILPIANIVSELPAPIELLTVLTRVDLPDKTRWIELVEKALHAIESGRIDKVVLARETTLSLSKAPNPFAVASRLSNLSIGSSLFCIDFENGKSLVGSTPERIFKRDQSTILAEALAGTRKRAENIEKDNTLRSDLLSSEKDLREFEFVKQYLSFTIAPFCIEPPKVSDTQIHRTAAVQHLHAKAAGTLKLIDDDNLLSAFHPSPALSGWPKTEALEWIRKNEPFDRGYYCGAVGWKTEEASDWSALIRCCFIEGATAKLYAGTGIVKGSDANKEWDELESKISLFKEVFSCLS